MVLFILFCVVRSEMKLFKLTYEIFEVFWEDGEGDAGGCEFDFASFVVSSGIYS